MRKGWPKNRYEVALLAGRRSAAEQPGRTLPKLVLPSATAAPRRTSPPLMMAAATAARAPWWCSGPTTGPKATGAAEQWYWMRC